MFEFPISGIETYWWLPTIVALGISMTTSTAGVTGAFILLPFQVSILGYTAPGVSGTNLMYNVVAIPGGVMRFWREQRVLWPIALTTALAAIPGLVIGAIIRVDYMPNPRPFKLFAGLVLLYLGIKLMIDIIKKSKLPVRAATQDFRLSRQRFRWSRMSWQFNNEEYSCPTKPVAALSFVVGIIGGIYGIGGGAILSPYLVAIYHLPVHAIAGAMLVQTWIVSILGVLVYFALSPILTGSTAASPDWLLGAAFGIGGMVGVYMGAFLQRYIPAAAIKVILSAALLFIAVRYIWGYFI